MNHLRLNPHFAAKVVLVTCIFHNVAIKFRTNEEELEFLEDNINEDVEENADENNVEEERIENSNRIQNLLNFFN